MFVDDINVTGDNLEEMGRGKEKLEKRETELLGCKSEDAPIEGGLKLDGGPENPLVSQFMHNTKEVHMEAVTRILRYLKLIPDNDNRSTSGYSTLLGGNLVIWWSKKQFVIASSNTEAEFGTMVHGLCELFWIKIILSILDVHDETSQMQVPQVTEEVAVVVLDLYPTLLSLARAYSLLDGDILAQEEMLRKQSNNMVNAVASRNIFKLVWGD
ncbi:Crossover junction endonuclease MUS81 [Vitis vinifera]|uniref:Crossover junction endonuclease MUS81 n=1 Tax=Vitis vinifera TaxID=29760 RepID=A0A438CY29_VITVI|nr:Crossover junction endonuclease MUS81 [Vitis vinifera]